MSTAQFLVGGSTSASAPVYSFTGNADTGVFSNGTNLGLAVGGTEQATVKANGQLILNGANPELQLSDTNNAVRYGGTNTVVVKTNSTDTATFESSTGVLTLEGSAGALQLGGNTYKLALSSTKLALHAGDGTNAALQIEDQGVLTLGTDATTTQEKPILYLHPAQSRGNGGVFTFANVLAHNTAKKVFDFTIPDDAVNVSFQLQYTIRIIQDSNNTVIEVYSGSHNGVVGRSATSGTLGSAMSSAYGVANKNLTTSSLESVSNSNFFSFNATTLNQVDATVTLADLSGSAGTNYTTGYSIRLSGIVIFTNCENNGATPVPLIQNTV